MSSRYKVRFLYAGRHSCYAMCDLSSFHMRRGLRVRRIKLCGLLDNDTKVRFIHKNVSGLFRSPFETVSLWMGCETETVFACNAVKICN